VKRLLIDSEVVHVLETLPAGLRRQLWRRIEAIGATPDRFADYLQTTPGGRVADVNLCGRFAIAFWDDHADRHVKILALGLADR